MTREVITHKRVVEHKRVVDNSRHPFAQFPIVLAISAAVSMSLLFGGFMDVGIGSAQDPSSQADSAQTSDSDTAAIESEDIDTAGMSVIGYYSASSTSVEEGRATNIELASDALNGTRIEAGETISFNSIVGDTAKDGRYKEATVLDGVSNALAVGGGICEVSTALYLAGLQADMKVIERHPHTVPSDYAPIGLDATVDYGTKDLVLQNTSGSAMVVLSESDGQKVSVTIMGAPRASSESINITSQIVGAQSQQNGSIGAVMLYTADSYRTYYTNGKVTRTELISEDVYTATTQSTVEASGNNAK